MPKKEYKNKRRKHPRQGNCFQSLFCCFGKPKNRENISATPSNNLSDEVPHPTLLVKSDEFNKSKRTAAIKLYPRVKDVSTVISKISLDNFKDFDKDKTKNKERFHSYENDSDNLTKAVPEISVNIKDIELVVSRILEQISTTVCPVQHVNTLPSRIQNLYNANTVKPNEHIEEKNPSPSTDHMKLEPRNMKLFPSSCENNLKHNSNASIRGPKFPKLRDSQNKSKPSGDAPSTFKPDEISRKITTKPEYQIYLEKLDCCNGNETLIKMLPNLEFINSISNVSNLKNLTISNNSLDKPLRIELGSSNSNLNLKESNNKAYTTDKSSKHNVATEKNIKISVETNKDQTNQKLPTLPAKNTKMVNFKQRKSLKTLYSSIPTQSQIDAPRLKPKMDVPHIKIHERKSPESINIPPEVRKIVEILKTAPTPPPLNRVSNRCRRVCVDPDRSELSSIIYNISSRHDSKTDLDDARVSVILETFNKSPAQIRKQGEDEVIKPVNHVQGNYQYDVENSFCSKIKNEEDKNYLFHFPEKLEPDPSQKELKLWQENKFQTPRNYSENLYCNEVAGSQPDEVKWRIILNPQRNKNNYYYSSSDSQQFHF